MPWGLMDRFLACGQTFFDPFHSIRCNTGSSVAKIYTEVFAKSRRENTSKASDLAGIYSHNGEC